MSRAPLKTVFGCMEFWGRCNLKESVAMVKMAMDHGCFELDTAGIYSDGKSEELMGQMEILGDQKVTIATKAHPRIGKGLTYEGVVEQLDSSLDRLKRKCVDILYLHQPDHNTPIEETLRGVDKLHKDGKFKELGLSNYSSWQVSEIYYLCKMNNYVLPTVYQGMYNAITREVDGELFPCIRRFGLRFYAYNPLAGGILTGKHQFEDKDKDFDCKGRFYGNIADRSPWSPVAEMYRKRYWRKELFNEVDAVNNTISQIYSDDVKLIGASFRWMYHHSLLDSKHGDAVILGASSLKQLEENLAYTKDGPLHEDVVKAFDSAWQTTKGNVACYFR